LIDPLLFQHTNLIQLIFFLKYFNWLFFIDLIARISSSSKNKITNKKDAKNSFHDSISYRL